MALVKNFQTPYQIMYTRKLVYKFVLYELWVLKTRYCPWSIASCDLLVTIFVMLKILRLLFVGRIELFNNNGRLALVKTKTTTRGTQSIMAHTGPLSLSVFFSSQLC